MTTFGELKLLLLIEEGHKVAGRDTNTSPSESFTTSKAHASHVVVRAMAELRSSGIGILVSDQTPSAVASAVLKHTAVKFIMQLTDKDDREEAGDSATLSAAEKEDLARLRPRDAYLFGPGYHEARLIRTIDLRSIIQLEPPATDTEIRAVLHAEDWFCKLRTDRRTMELAQFRTRLKESSRGILALQRQVDRCKDSAQRLVQAGSNTTASLNKQLGCLRSALADIKVQATRLIESFNCGPLAQYMDEDDTWAGPDDPILAERQRCLTDYGTLAEAANAIIRVVDAVLNAIPHEEWRQ